MTFDIDALVAAGLTPIPVMRATKAPANGFSQQAFYNEKPTPESIRGAWEKYGKGADAIALVCGHGVEVLDADVNHDPVGLIHAKFEKALEEHFPGLLARLVIETSQSGGVHYWYKVPSNRPSTKLATYEYDDADRFALNTEQKSGVVLETRGSGGYCIVQPTAGYIPVNGRLEEMPMLTEEERDAIFDVARSFNQHIPPVTYVKGESAMPSGTDTRPGDDYSAKVSIDEMIGVMSDAGWTPLRHIGNYIYLNRPGAKNARGTDGYVVVNKRLFVCESTSVPDFIPKSGYSFYRTYAILKHGGNFSEASKALRAAGYGNTSFIREHGGHTTAAAPALILSPSDVLEKYDQYRFKLHERPQVDFNLFVKGDAPSRLSQPSWHGMAFPGAVMAFVGKEKSRKTTVLTAIAASSLAMKQVCGFDYREPGNVLWIDTEQPNFYFWLTQWRVAVQAGDDCKARYYSYMFRSMSKKDRRAGVVELIDAVQPKVLILDGIGDFVKSVNDEEECYAFVDEWLLPLASRGITILPVLHLNKSDGQMSGWIGTVLARKADGAFMVTAVDDWTVEVTMRNARSAKFPAFQLRTKHGMHGILYRDEVPEYNYRLGYENEQQIYAAAVQEQQEISEAVNQPAGDLTEDIPF